MEGMSLDPAAPTEPTGNGGSRSRLQRFRHRYRIGARAITMGISGLLAFGLLVVMLGLPVPYAVEGPGPTFNTLGEVSDHPLISIDGTKTYSSDGQLRLTTVTSAGGPGFPVNAGSVIRGWLSPSMMVQPAEAVFGPELTEQEREHMTTAQMTSSQRNATAAALTALEYDVPATMEIVGAYPESGAAGIVQEGDVLTGLTTDSGEHQLDSYTELSEILADTPAGSTVTLEVERAGERTPLSIRTSQGPQGGSLLGVALDVQFDFPVDVDIEIDNVGGPSAGTMFALGIMDLLTPDSLTGGHVVAGTGTISPDGRVGPIGGITLKMKGAVRDGAEYFLAPASNCSQVAGHVPEDLQVIRVATLSEAHEAVQAIAAGDTTDLPDCAS